MEADRIQVRPFLIACAGLFILEGGGIPLMNAGWRYPVAVLGLLRIAEICLVIGIFRWWGRGLKDVGLGRDQIWAGMRQGMIWSVGFGVLVLIGFGVLVLMGRNPLQLLRMRLPDEPIARFWYILVGTLVAPVGEELFFRGMLYGYFRRWGIPAALAASSLLFVSAHSAGGIPVTQAVGAVLFAVAYEIEGKLMTPITLHVLGNLALLSLSLLS